MERAFVGESKGLLDPVEPGEGVEIKETVPPIRPPSPSPNESVGVEDKEGLGESVGAPTVEEGVGEARAVRLRDRVEREESDAPPPIPIEGVTEEVREAVK